MNIHKCMCVDLDEFDEEDEELDMVQISEKEMFALLSAEAAMRTKLKKSHSGTRLRSGSQLPAKLGASTKKRHMA